LFLSAAFFFGVVLHEEVLKLRSVLIETNNDGSERIVASVAILRRVDAPLAELADTPLEVVYVYSLQAPVVNTGEFNPERHDAPALVDLEAEFRKVLDRDDSPFRHVGILLDDSPSFRR